MISTEAYLRVDDRHILDDYQLPVTPHWFNRYKLFEIAQVSGKSEGGRHNSLFFKFDEQEYMLKHYYRGGAVQRLLEDYYLYIHSSYVNVFVEWRLLHQLQRWHLPAPVPCAASYVDRLIFYTADIILQSCRPARPISALLCEQQIEEKHWQLIGRTIRRFHDKNVYHADLNAHNILLYPEKDQAYLVDFDRSCICVRRSPWRQANLNRLARSLKKLSAKYGSDFHYAEDNFSALVDAYRQG